MSEIPQEQIQVVEQEPQVVKSVRKSRRKLILALIAAIGLPVLGGGVALYLDSQKAPKIRFDFIEEINKELETEPDNNIIENNNSGKNNKPDGKPSQKNPPANEKPAEQRNSPDNYNEPETSLA